MTHSVKTSYRTKLKVRADFVDRLSEIMYIYSIISRFGLGFEGGDRVLGKIPKKTKRKFSVLIV